MNKFIIPIICLLFTMICVSCNDAPPPPSTSEVYEGDNFIVYLNKEKIDYVESVRIEKYYLPIIQSHSYKLIIKGFPSNNSISSVNIQIENDKFSTEFKTNALYDKTSDNPNFNYYTTYGINGQFLLDQNSASNSKKLILDIYTKEQHHI